MDARSNPDDARPRQRFRPRLWWLLVLVLVCALIFGGLAQLQCQRRAAALAQLEAQLAAFAELEAQQALMLKAIANETSAIAKQAQQDEIRRNDRFIAAIRKALAEKEAEIKTRQVQTAP